MYDIAVNKIHTIASRTRARDYIDLYFIMKDSKFPANEYLEKLRLDSKAKFDWPLESKNLVAAFLKVVDLEKADFPKMLVTFNKDYFEKFYLGLAESLESGIFK